VLTAAGLALVSTSPASAQATQLFPGVTYTNDVQFTPRGPVAVRVVRGPRPTGLYRLRTALSNETVLREEPLSSMQRRLAGEATMVGVNGDFSRIADGRPNGILVRDGVLVTPPSGERSSLGIQLDGLLDVRRVGFAATWRGSEAPRKLDDLNDVPRRNGIALFTPDWGPATPRLPGSYAVVLEAFPAAVPGTDLVGTVTSVAQGASVPLAPGRAVLVASGSARTALRVEAPVGAAVTVRLTLRPDWATVSDAVGGGPLLVRDGKVVHDAGEAFTSSQLVPRHPRTAVGQLADGRLVFAVVDGRQPGYSIGMTTLEMALLMVRLGAVEAMQLDGGGSSTLAFDGRVLNVPSDGRERPVPTALLLEYHGVYLRPPAEEVVSPNGDRVADTQRLSLKIVRPSTVSVTMTSPSGAPVRETRELQPGAHRIAFPLSPSSSRASSPRQGIPADGRWTLSVTAVDDQGLASSHTRRFSVNSTLGFLDVTPRRIVLRKTSGSTTIAWAQARAARVLVVVRTPEGALVRRLLARRLERGRRQVVWSGRLANGKPAPGGRFVVVVTATNELGSVTLEHPVTVRRVAAGK
jgi:hypothetical protein